MYFGEEGVGTRRMLTKHNVDLLCTNDGMCLGSSHTPVSIISIFLFGSCFLQKHCRGWGDVLFLIVCLVMQKLMERLVAHVQDSEICCSKCSNSCSAHRISGMANKHIHSGLGTHRCVDHLEPQFL